MRILGVDPGTRIIGYGVIDALGNRIEAVACGTIRPSNKADIDERLKEIHCGIREVIRKTGPDMVAVEEVFHGPNTLSLIKMSEARGVILLAAALEGLPVRGYAPAMIKKAVTGRGNAAKEQVKEMVDVILGEALQFETSDVSDAMAVAICQAHRKSELAAD